MATPYILGATQTVEIDTTGSGNWVALDCEVDSDHTESNENEEITNKCSGGANERVSTSYDSGITSNFVVDPANAALAALKTAMRPPVATIPARVVKSGIPETVTMDCVIDSLNSPAPTKGVIRGSVTLTQAELPVFT